MLVVFLAAALPAQTPATKVTLLDAELPLLNWSDGYLKTHGGVRLLDGITGEPLAGAELFAITEEAFPLPGAFRFVHRGVADKDGFASLPSGQYWQMARAPGFGPKMNLGYDQPVWLLGPAVDVPIRMVDWLGRPLAGAVAGFCGGCGHTCDLVNATVDADGIAWLRVDPHGSCADIYPEMAAVVFSYENMLCYPGDAPEEFAYGYGEEVHGTILLADGTPAAGVIVGTYKFHRGPWTKADEQGRFRLFGLEPEESFFVVLDDRKVECPWPSKMPCELRLPEPNGDLVQELVPAAATKDPLYDLILTCTDERGAEVDVDSSLWLRSDGRREWLFGSGKQLMPAGTYQVTTRDPRFEYSQHVAEIRAIEGQDVRLQLRRLPMVRISVSGVPADVSVAVVRREQGLGRAEDPTVPIEVPVRADEIFAVHLENGDEGGRTSRWFQFRADEAIAKGELSVAWYAPTVVEALLVDDQGKPAAAGVKLLSRCEVFDGKSFDPRSIVDLDGTADGHVRVEADTDRLCFLLVRPDDPALRSRLLAVAMPARSDDAKVDLGTIRLAREPALRLLAATGEAPFAQAASLLRAGYGSFDDEEMPQFALGDDGSWLGPDLEPGDAVLVASRSDGEVALRHVVRDRLPKVVRPLLGRLTLRVLDPSRAPIDCTVFVADTAIRCDGETTLTQLREGPLTLFLAAEGYRSAKVELVVTPSPTEPIAVLLPMR